MKGVTTIELTDVNTGEKQTYKDENMFTNALQEIYNNNFLRFGVTTNNGFFGSLIRDLSSLESIIGGVYCLDKTLDEDASIIEVPSDCTIVAHASGKYTGNSSSRGTLNVEESAELDNGYKFVWDFATNQGNGTIKCIGLTTSYGGSCGEDFGYADGSIISPYMTVEDTSYTMANNGTSGINTQINTAAFDDDLRLYYCQINSSTQITIWKGSRPFPYKSPNLMNYDISDSDNYPFYADKSVTITLPVNLLSTNADSTRFICDNDGKLYLISINTIYIYVYELDYSNAEVTNYYTVSVSEIGGYVSTATLGRFVSIHNGYLYYTNSSEAEGCIQKVDYKTGDIVQTSPLMEDTSSTFYVLGLDYNDHVMIASTTQNYYWDEDSNMIHRMGNLVLAPYTIKWVSPYHFIGLFSVANSSSSSASRVVYRFATNKPLITINNLSTAVTKTSAQTMKITYTVTES